MYDEEILSLKNAMTKKDELTALHSKDVGLLCSKIVKEFNKKGIELPFSAETAYLAGLLHDIGKLKMSDKILKGTEKFSSPKDIFEIKMHPVDGYNILTNLGFADIITKSVLSHHERYDGSGYPYGLKKDEINMLSSIIGVADTYSAIIQKRPYKKEKTKNEALLIIKNDYHLFNPIVLNVFFEMIIKEDIFECICVTA